MRDILSKSIDLGQEAYTCVISSFIKKDTSIWIFGAIQGQKYLDNAQYLFEYISQHTDISPIWISKNIEVVKNITARGYIAYHEKSKEAKYFSMRASVAVITHRANRHKSDLPFYMLSKKTKVIQLWHGVPLKKIAYDDKVFGFKENENNFNIKMKKVFVNFFLPFLNYVHNPELIIALSEETQKIFSNAFRIDKNHVKITGYPRNDIFLKNYLLSNVSQKIIYMPTFRGATDTHFDLFLNYGFDVDKLDLFLRDNSIKLDIKLHPFNHPSNKLISALEESENIFLLHDVSIYEKLGDYSLLITDYSSIYFDYLLLDRPIIFSPFDMENYLKNDRDFYFEYKDVTPGLKALGWDEVMECIIEYRMNPELYRKERQILRDRFHKYQDTNSSKRVFEAILETCNG